MSFQTGQIYKDKHCSKMPKFKCDIYINFQRMLDMLDIRNSILARKFKYR